MYIIPDLHGSFDRLSVTLSALEAGYEDDLLFLGDLIDNGAENAAVCAEVLDRVDRDQAICLMGNHELNAILFHRRGTCYGPVQDGFMRAHSAQNISQHASFLSEFLGREKEMQALLARLLELPLVYETEQIRAVHACWDEESVKILRARRQDARLHESDLQEVALEETEFAKAVIMLLKGPEISLPGDVRYADHYGTMRSTARLNWWSKSSDTYRGAVLSVPDRNAIPDIPLPENVLRRSNPPRDKPIFFGHYKMREIPDPHDQAICLDVPKETVLFRINGAARELILPDRAAPCP